MSVLSITFHCPKVKINDWEIYVHETLFLMTENLIDVNQYIFSEVDSDYIEEGKNYNLLLIFDNNEKRIEFAESELKNIIERVEAVFGSDVMIFKTDLNPKKIKL